MKRCVGEEGYTYSFLKTIFNAYLFPKNTMMRGYAALYNKSNLQ